MFASVKSNDMTSFKAWLDAGGDGIDKEVNAIQYGYGVIAGCLSCRQGR